MPAAKRNIALCLYGERHQNDSAGSNPAAST